VAAIVVVVLAVVVGVGIFIVKNPTVRAKLFPFSKRSTITEPLPIINESKQPDTSSQWTTATPNKTLINN